MSASSASAIISRLALNVAMIGRDLFDAHSNEGSGHYHNYYASTIHPSAVGLDILVRNKGTNAAVVSLDGVQFTILGGESISITNTPFFEFRVISSDPQAIDYYVQGVYIYTLENLMRSRR